MLTPTLFGQWTLPDWEILVGGVEYQVFRLQGRYGDGGPGLSLGLGRRLLVKLAYKRICHMIRSQKMACHYMHQRPITRSLLKLIFKGF